MTLRLVTACLLLGCLAIPSAGQSIEPYALPGLHAHLRVLSYHNAPGKPVWVSFSIENTSDEPVTLVVPGKEPAIPSPEVGLPLSHVFSSVNGPAVVIETDSGSRWETPLAWQAPEEAPILIVAPRSSVGTMVDLRQHFPALRGAGQYRVTWAPYGGLAAPATAVISVDTLKEAVITTDEGQMRMRFFYKDAPLTIANFIELIRDRFYDGRSFHRIEPGYLVQGGCPRGDGTGIRLNGQRIPPEFNDNPHQKGSVSMALLDDDPESASCQFFISNTRQKDWDGKYTVFGQLVGDESFATLDRIMAKPVNEFGQPLEPVFIRSIRISDAPSSAYADMR